MSENAVTDQALNDQDIPALAFWLRGRVADRAYELYQAAGYEKYKEADPEFAPVIDAWNEARRVENAAFAAWRLVVNSHAELHQQVADRLRERGVQPIVPHPLAR
jgi:hypothetical protein